MKDALIECKGKEVCLYLNATTVTGEVVKVDGANDLVYLEHKPSQAKCVVKTTVRIKAIDALKEYVSESKD